MTSDPDSPAVVSNGLPWLTSECSARWFGHRIVYWPNGIPPHRRISVVSSRLRERLDLESWWFDLLRTTVLQCDPATELLCAVDETAAFEVTERACELFGRTLLRFQLPETSLLHSESETAEWLNCVADRWRLSASPNDSTDKSQVRIAVVSPELIRGERNRTDEQKYSVPLADRLLFASGSRIHVLACRDDGNVASLLHRHYNDEDRKHVPVLIAADKFGRMPESVRQLPTGWVPWLVQPFLRCLTDETDGSDTVLGAAPESVTPSVHRVSSPDSNPLSHPGEWLSHWTRSARGPWPGEARTDFLDSLIMGCEVVDRSALATLLRILTDGVLRASPEGIRGGFCVVSFTQVPLSEFRVRRVFRKHRRRFDFEPWGLAIRRDVLESSGVRQVIYGDDGDWSNLLPALQPFFQKSTSGGPTDNLSEREWRAVSDLKLQHLPPESVCVFADTAEAAQLISRHCIWPVVVVPAAK